jgi:acyl-CoA synthetase (AMP-forming)/AMP-acid ligase II
LSSKRSSDDSYDEPSRAGKAYDGDGFAFVRVAKSFRDDGAVAEFADPGDANTGEIVIGGACVCEGYLNDAALTSKTFVDSP